MNLLLIQIVVVLFAVAAAMGVWRRYRKGELSLGLAASWAALWSVAAVAVLLPNAIQRLAILLGVGRGADAVFYLGIVTLLYLQFRTFARLEKMEQTVTKVVRAGALKEFFEDGEGKREK